MDIEGIRRLILSGRYVVSFTHTEKLRRRKISIETIEEALHHGGIIEDYPDDPRGPSCLVLGIAQAGRPLHVVCGKTEDDQLTGDYGL
jgi:hypothetical protein